MKNNINEPVKGRGLGMYRCPEAKVVEYVSTTIVCTSPDANFESVDEENFTGLWE